MINRRLPAHNSREEAICIESYLEKNLVSHFALRSFGAGAHRLLRKRRYHEPHPHARGH